MLRRTIPALFLLIGCSAYAQDVNDATEKAMKDAAAKIAPSIARIETSGGAEAVWGAGRKGPEVMFRRGVGATTGGPLLAIDGRVMGVIVPISPSSDGETAGFEWHDAGIGFAIPFEDVLRVVPQLKAGTPEKPINLKPGMIGVTFREPDQFSM